MPIRCVQHRLVLIGLLFCLLFGVVPGYADRAYSARYGEARSRAIVLFDAASVAQYKPLLSTKPSRLFLTRQDDLRRYGRSLIEVHQQFLSNLRQIGIEAQLNHDFTYLLNGMAITINSKDVDRLLALPGVRGIYADNAVHVDLTESVPLIGADHLWQMTDSQQRPITGQGIRVAVIDTGIDYTHPDLGGCLGPGCKVVDGFDIYNSDPDPLDDNGHGTHCAGIVAADGTMKGVAPGASLLAYKVLDANGLGTISGIIAGMERAADPDEDPATADAADIISLSLGYPGTPGDPWSLAVEAAADQGILVVVAAGNNGPGYSNLDSPGLDAKAFTVGASDKNDVIASFSSRGPVPGYPDLIKPDIVAPGEGIVSTWLGGGYASADGTSMATPHVSGAAALVWQAHPGWTAEMVRANLMNTAVDLGENVHTQGAGRVQVDNAVVATAVASPGALGFGLVAVNQPQWSVSRSLWITNTFPTAKNYSFTIDAPWLDGDPSSWPVTAALSAEQVSLAGGQGMPVTLTLTMTSSQVAPDLDRNEGRIQIQSGETLLTVPFAFQIPPIFSESRVMPFPVQTSFDVTLGDLDGDGDLDAFVGNTAYYDNPANTVWLNEGQGVFVDSGQRLGSSFTWAVALGDLDGDGDLDAFVANGE